MRADYNQYSEDKLDRKYDLNLLRRLAPFAVQYKLLFFITVILVILISIMDIAVPYVTKIAIDRYIVPNMGKSETPHHEKNDLHGFYHVDTKNKAFTKLIDKNPELFKIQGQSVWISHKNLSRLSKKEISLLRHDDLKGVALSAFAVIFIVIAIFCLNFIQVMIMEYAGQMIMHDIRMKLFTHIQGLSLAYFTRNPVGRLVTRTTNDIQNMHEMFTSVITFVFKDIFLLTGITIVLLTINVKLALVTLAILPVLILIAIKFAGAAREAFRELRVKLAEINSRFSETIEGIRIIQLFRQEAKNYRNLKKLNHEYYLAGILQIKVFAVFMPLIELLGSIAIAVIIFYGGTSVIKAGLSLGSLVAFISYARMFFRPIRDIAEKVNIMQNALASAERIFLILDTSDQSSESDFDQNTQLGSLESLEFENVSFSYGNGRDVLKNISLKMNKGESVAIVGPTGAGKTSIINLVVRFYEPSSGRIIINNNDIRSLPLNTIRNKISIVPQDPFLFSASIRENIVMVNKNISEKDLDRVLDISNCRAFIDRMPHGLDTVLSERGGSISSGERQLISIARALASEPDLIVFDEATSYVDSDTELKIQDAMEKLLLKKTTLIIAHRLSTARKANLIIVLKHGKIVEEGNHDMLMDKKGFYYNLSQLQ